MDTDKEKKEVRFAFFLDVLNGKIPWRRVHRQIGDITLLCASQHEAEEHGIPGSQNWAPPTTPDPGRKRP